MVFLCIFIVSQYANLFPLCNSRARITGSSKIQFAKVFPSTIYISLIHKFIVDAYHVPENCNTESRVLVAYHRYGQLIRSTYNLKADAILFNLTNYLDLPLPLSPHERTEQLLILYLIGRVVLNEFHERSQ